MSSTSASAAGTASRDKFGSFESPITLDLVLGSFIGISLPRYNRSTSSLYWIENRPSQKGRNALAQLPLNSASGAKIEVLPEEKWNARSRVHEYGGGSYATLDDGRLVFEHVEGGTWAVEPKAHRGEWQEPKRVTKESKVDRFANFSSAHPEASSLILAVHEDHTIDEPAKVVNNIVLIDTSTEATPTVVIGGADFYSCPSFSPSGKSKAFLMVELSKYVSWIEWYMPDMPWEGSLLNVAPVSLSENKKSIKIDVSSKQLVAGQSKNVESVSQARWAADDDRLIFLCDRTGYYELYQWTEGKDAKMVLSEPTVHDVGPPDWQFGNVTHDFLDSKKWISNAKGGSLRVVDVESGSSKVISTPYQAISSITVISPTQVVVQASVATTPDVLALIDLASEGSEPRVLETESTASVDPGYISVGKEITFPAEDGSDSYAVFYPPASKDHPNGSSDPNEKPPLLIYAHGGPTSKVSRGLEWGIQLLTSRGFAYCGVDYAGSAGYGKEYRQRLAGQWGLADVSDVVSCAKYLASQGFVDPKRVGITGGSAGGFTVLAALCAAPEVFTCGISHYGISDLALLAGDTHKFESQYLFALVGGTLEEVPEVYHDRSPLYNADKIRAPLLLLQGTEDKVVPPEQAEKMKEVVEANKGKCELVLFEGEGHGFRKAENKKRAIEGQLEWLRETWGIAGGRS
ncbi:BQ2448_7241 [Microbotryum intermedium]|uniref:BQ2448_7241 protein n=1 Tax=Microbotryum intermedium TaxID=269621 RepID=A0A238FJI1_9BASI|nr:BQ2448_7241 [Microbotryum intermedium]